ncbi:MAG: DUF4445 domain-containing protein [Clostridia bacterium]|nr:DUF4445 domain-containing protein [Clostridia bacterium]
MYKVSINGEILLAESGETLSSVLMRYGKGTAHPCGGRGVCGKCRVYVNGNEELSCRYRITSDIDVETYGTDKKSEIDYEKAVDGECCFVLDIGTTTLALALVSIAEKRIIKTVTSLNPQRVFGADVISRIDYCTKNSTEKLQKVLTDEINNMIAKFKGCKSDRLYVSANTTMLHILFGEDCSSLGVAPYEPVFLDGRCVNATSLGIAGVSTVESLPCVASFVGADIVAGMNLVGMPSEGKYSLLIDLGTNAEIVLMNKNGSVSTSAAAGPCFEGACIMCGMGAVNGAICSVKDGKLITVENTKAVGICGTGLIDAVAYMLDKGIIDSSGYMECEQVELAEGVYITQSDIRQYQLAKSAVYSAIMALVKYCTITPDDIETVYISGGFSSGICVDSAIKTGLLPAEFKDKCVALSNSSLLGTVKYATEKNDLESLAKKTEYIDLSADVFFSDLFIDNMLF